MLDTRGRVSSHTQNEINERIRAETARSVHYFEGRMDEISVRLRVLDENGISSEQLKRMPQPWPRFGRQSRKVSRPRLW
jgi:hypothetical protein